MFDGAKVEGTFDPQHIYNVLARILSDREGVEITPIRSEEHTSELQSH